jgi:hypothetical protein
VYNGLHLVEVADDSRLNITKKTTFKLKTMNTNNDQAPQLPQNAVISRFVL